MTISSKGMYTWTSSGPPPTGKNPAFSTNKFVEIKAFRDNVYLPGSLYTPTQLISLIQSIHSVIGNFNITKFLRSACSTGVMNPSTTIPGWSGTLDTFVSAAKQACGGEIVPDVDMDIYIGQPDCGGTPCQSCYFANAASLLKLSAIFSGIKYIHQEAYCPAYFAHLNPSQSQVQTFFDTLFSQGWQGMMPQLNSATATSDKCPDYGNAGYVRVGTFATNGSVNQALINAVYQTDSSYKVLRAVMTGLESQILGGTSTIAQFANQSTSSQQSALNSWASNQVAGKYTWIYPVLVCQGDSYSNPHYDAAKAGTLAYIEGLLNKYN